MNNIDLLSFINLYFNNIRGAINNSETLHSLNFKHPFSFRRSFQGSIMQRRPKGGSVEVNISHGPKRVRASEFMNCICVKEPKINVKFGGVDFI